jgi:hypothetical protein
MISLTTLNVLDEIYRNLFPIIEAIIVVLLIHFH